jgi:hypothetical protein
MSIDRNLVLRCALESGFVLSTFNGGTIKKLAPMADVDSLCRLIKAYEAARAAPAGQQRGGDTRMREAGCDYKKALADLWKQGQAAAIPFATRDADEPVTSLAPYKIEGARIFDALLALACRAANETEAQ